MDVRFFLRPLDKGFTLIELMIVVAIIGILAAVAVPGFMRYIKDSKTSEAKDNLKAISDGALTFFETEHDFLGTGMNPRSRIYPTSVEVGGGVDYAGAETTSTIGDNSVVGQKNSPNADATVAALAAAPWTQIKYQVNKPFYYQYIYSASGAANECKFGTSAVASLSDDKDSAFIINGDPTGKVGNIIECADGDTTTATASGGSAKCKQLVVHEVYMIMCNSTGFTLIELMIVVAIIGILAAVAIPGFGRYMRDSKKSEASGMLRAVSDGAVAYYSTEHVFDSLGLDIRKDFFPGCEDSGEPSACDNVSVYSGERGIAQRISPLDENIHLDEVPWTRLNLTLKQPFLYVLFYTSDPTPASSSFSSRAVGWLEGEEDSILQISGNSGSGGKLTIGTIVTIKDGND